MLRFYIDQKLNIGILFFDLHLLTINLHIIYYNLTKLIMDKKTPTNEQINDSIENIEAVNVELQTTEEVVPAKTPIKPRSRTRIAKPELIENKAEENHIEVSAETVEESILETNEIKKIKNMKKSEKEIAKKLKEKKKAKVKKEKQKEKDRLKKQKAKKREKAKKQKAKDKAKANKKAKAKRKSKSKKKK